MGAQAASIAGVSIATGSNREHFLSRADWRFMVPRDRSQRVLFLGAPAPGELAAFDSAATVVVVELATRSQRAHDPNTVIAPGPNNIITVRAATSALLPFRPQSFDLVVVGNRLSAGQLMFPSIAFRDLRRIARPNACVVIETRFPGGAALARRWLRQCLGAVHSVVTYWTVWRKGCMRAAVPLQAAAPISRYLFRHVLYGRTVAGRRLIAGAVALARIGQLHRILSDRMVVAVCSEGRPVAFQPIVEAAARHGLDVGAHSAALLASGNYDSNKNALFLFPPAESTPDLLVKVTRSPAYNYRLLAEHGALTLLGSGKFVPAGTYPKVVFLDAFGDLTLLGQRVVQGVPFRRVTTAQPGCDSAARAIRWISQLGATSAMLADENRSLLTSRFERLLSRVAANYKLQQWEYSVLEESFSSVARRERACPLVFRHADAGTWNLLVTSSGDVAFLDWELAERRGPPLWDLLDFVYSFGSWVGRVHGDNDPVSSHATMFLQSSPMLDLLVRVTQQYCTVLQIERSDIPALVYAYWLDRADRQSAWATGVLEEASYIRILRNCINERHSVEMRRLFECGGHIKRESSARSSETTSA
jgi:hypothetical protein